MASRYEYLSSHPPPRFHAIVRNDPQYQYFVESDTPGSPEDRIDYFPFREATKYGEFGLRDVAKGGFEGRDGFYYSASHMLTPDHLYELSLRSSSKRIYRRERPESFIPVHGHHPHYPGPPTRRKSIGGGLAGQPSALELDPRLYPQPQPQPRPHPYAPAPPKPGLARKSSMKQVAPAPPAPPAPIPPAGYPFAADPYAHPHHRPHRRSGSRPPSRGANIFDSSEDDEDYHISPVYAANQHPYGARPAVDQRTADDAALSRALQEAEFFGSSESDERGRHRTSYPYERERSRSKRRRRSHSRPRPASGYYEDDSPGDNSDEFDFLSDIVPVIDSNRVGGAHRTPETGVYYSGGGSAPRTQPRSGAIRVNTGTAPAPPAAIGRVSYPDPQPPTVDLRGAYNMGGGPSASVLGRSGLAGGGSRSGRPVMSGALPDSRVPPPPPPPGYTGGMMAPAPPAPPEYTGGGAMAPAPPAPPGYTGGTAGRYGTGREERYYENERRRRGRSRPRREERYERSRSRSKGRRRRGEEEYYGGGYGRY